MAGTNTWSQLTPAQQAQVLAFMPLFRAAVVQLVAAADGGAKLDSIWTNGISAVVESLAPGTVIPDSTGLAGASPLMMDVVVGQMAAIEQLLTGANTAQARAAYLEIVGPANM
jgi:hypothetical protein